MIRSMIHGILHGMVLPGHCHGTGDGVAGTARVGVGDGTIHTIAPTIHGIVLIITEDTMEDIITVIHRILFILAAEVITPTEKEDQPTQM